MSEHRGWEHRHTQAAEAWERGDVWKLIKLCQVEINTEGRKHEAACRGAVRLEDFAQAGCEAVWKYWKNFNPDRDVPFQAFIRQHIRGAMACLTRESFQVEHEQRYLAYEAALQSYGRYAAEGAIPPRKNDHAHVHSALQSLVGDESQYSRS
jgi:DNA-directed RNA polymerase specialized sigma subunit